MVELSILATTLCGVMISFSFETFSLFILFLFVLSSSFFIASGTGLIFVVLIDRGYIVERRPIDIMEKLRALSLLLFLSGMTIFFMGVALMVAFNIVFYVFVVIPFVIILFSFVYYSRKHKPS